MTLSRAGIRFPWPVAFLFAIGACQSEAILVPASRELRLREVVCGVHDAVLVPGTCPSIASGDSIRYVAGLFILAPGRRWESHWERVLVTNGIDGERRTFSISGRYRIVSHTEKQVVLDLYPGQIIPLHMDPTVIIRRDTLYHSAFRYSR
jgi:hypothetical protein